MTAESIEAGLSHSPEASTSTSAAAPAGSFEYVTAVDERLCCPICQAPMQDPWMSKTCEHFYCYECILQHLTGNEAPGTCPCDRSPLQLYHDQPSDKRQLVPAPRLVKLLCDELVVRCTSSTTCKWTGQRSHWARHLEHECSRRPTDACPNDCGYRWKNMTAHENECTRRPTQCQACHESLPASEIQSHAQDCPQAPVSCPNCKDENLARSKLEEHVRDTCPESQIQCPHVRYGCQWKGKRRLLRHDHLEVDCIFEPLKGVLDAHEDRIASLETENNVLKRDLRDLRLVFEDLEQRVEQLTVTVGLNTTQDRVAAPLSQQVQQIGSQVSDLTRSSTRAQRSSEQALHEVKGEMSNMQMMMHDIRGELMALQHAQYYENAYRQWGRAGQAPAKPSSASASNKDSEGSDSEGETASQATASFGRMGIPQPMSYGPGYPFPPYPMSHPGQPVFGNAGPPYGVPAPAPLFGPRRWSGWPYGIGSSSPEERGGGVKL